MPGILFGGFHRQGLVIGAGKEYQHLGTFIAGNALMHDIYRVGKGVALLKGVLHAGFLNRQ
ncbi:hypothetical protein D3C79_1097910 [compost metagenome]